MGLERDLESAMRTWVHALSPHTRKAYERGLVHFAEYLVQEQIIEMPALHPSRGDGAPMCLDSASLRTDIVATAGRYLLELDPGKANALVQAFLEHLSSIDESTGVPTYTSTTVNQRASSLRWAVREARRRGIVTWTLEVRVPKAKKDPSTGRPRIKAGRNMRGPTLAELAKMISLAKTRARGKSSDAGRWLLVLSLIAHETLREHEIVAIDLADLDRASGTIQVVRKKDELPTTVPLSLPTRNALRRWLGLRGGAPGPLLWGSKQGGTLVPGSRLTVDGIYYIVHQIGRKCGLRTSPHKVRHTAITVGQSVREELQIPLHDAMLRSGHRSIAAHERYLDPDIQNVRRLNDGVARRLREAES